MKVILKSDVKALGTAGQLVTVKDGYARNFLLPRGLAAEANPKNIRALEHEKRIILDHARKVRTDAASLAERISAATLTIAAKAGEEEKLFGSVTSMDIVSALKEQGIEIDKRRVVLEEPIKRLGTYTIQVRVHPEVTADLSVNVVNE